MPPINPRKVAIAHVFKLLSVLIAENNVYMKGQPIFAVDDITGKLGVKVGTWDWETTDISFGTAFVDLDWLITPAAAGTGGYTPFKIRTTDVQYAIVGADTVITDPRLIGVTDPIVSTTAEGVEWRDEDLVVDHIAGTVTILGFGSMDPTDHISIFVPSQVTSGGSLAALTARMDAVELLTAPIAAGAKLWWPLALGAIPTGWQECVAMQGYLPMHIKAGDPLLGGGVGTHGGSATHSNTIGEMAPHTHDYDDDAPQGAVDFGSGSTRPDYESTIVEHKTTASQGGGDPYSILNPVLFGYWIEKI